MNYVCLHYINHDFSVPCYFLTVTCSNIHLLLNIIAQYKLHWIQKELYCTWKKTKYAKIQKNKSQRATDLETKVSVSANRI